MNLTSANVGDGWYWPDGNGHGLYGPLPRQTIPLSERVIPWTYASHPSTNVAYVQLLFVSTLYTFIAILNDWW